jgi:hypothetical protein
MIFLGNCELATDALRNALGMAAVQQDRQGDNDGH